jgi:hypothetical protein
MTNPFFTGRVVGLSWRPLVRSLVAKNVASVIVVEQIPAHANGLTGLRKIICQLSLLKIQKIRILYNKSKKTGIVQVVKA